MVHSVIQGLLMLGISKANHLNTSQLFTNSQRSLEKGARISSRFSPSSQNPSAPFNADAEKKLGEYLIIKKMRSGTHPSYILQDSAGKLFFFKENRYSLINEVIASRLCNIITDGLVPVAKQGKIGNMTGVIEPFVELENSLFCDQNGFDPAKLTQKQQEHLFAHLISDYVVRNYDTHTGQFGIDPQGRVIGYDKGHAFSDFHTSEPSEFKPDYHWPPLDPDQPTYKIFSEYLRQNPAKAKALLNSEKVQSAFEKCLKISKAKTLQEIDKDLQSENFTKKILERAKKAPLSITQYFD